MKNKKILTWFLTCFSLSLGMLFSKGSIANLSTIEHAKASVISGWTRVTSLSEIEEGGTFIIGYEDVANSDVIIPLRSDGSAATTSANGLLYSGTTAGSSTDGTINMASILTTAPYEVTITSSTTTAGAVNIALSSGNYIGNSGAKNTARLYASTSKNTDYTPSISTNDVVTLTSPTTVSTTYTTLQYNTGAPRFSNYNGGQKNLIMYKAASSELSEISVSGTLVNTSYYSGESFNPDGLTITATYSDNSSKEVTSQCSFSPSVLGDDTTVVIASYTENGVTKTIEIDGFSVSIRTITSISVLAYPNKVTYTIGQTLDMTGLLIQATYNVGPTNDDYREYSYAPSTSFDSMGEKTITISSTENETISTQFMITVIDVVEGDYSITSGATSYQATMNPNSLIIGKSDESLYDLSFSSIDNVRLYGSPNVNSLMIGSGSTSGGSFKINLDERLYVSKIEFIDNVKDSSASNTETLSLNGTTVSFSSINASNSIVFKPYSNEIHISTTARLWVREIKITAKTATNAILDFGKYFLDCTDKDCTNLNVLSDTWNEIKDVYFGMDLGLKNLINSTTPNNNGNDLEKALGRYDFITSKYGYDAFINLSIQDSLEVNPVERQNGIFDNKSLQSVILISLFGLTSLAGFFYFKKKQIN